MNGRDFLPLAKSLLKDMTEAGRRSAVSRAYYAAFHVARRLMDDLGFAVPRADQAHGYLWLRLSNSSDLAVVDAGQRLGTLRRKRNFADYDVAASLSISEATAHVVDAEEIIQIFDAANVEPTRTQITDAMKVYERDVLKLVTWHP
jgi:uncharacterized protein (UPF0332 family)